MPSLTVGLLTPATYEPGAKIIRSNRCIGAARNFTGLSQAIAQSPGRIKVPADGFVGLGAARRLARARCQTLCSGLPRADADVERGRSNSKSAPSAAPGHAGYEAAGG